MSDQPGLVLDGQILARMCVALAPPALALLRWLSAKRLIPRNNAVDMLIPAVRWPPSVCRHRPGYVNSRLAGPTSQDVQCSSPATSPVQAWSPARQPWNVLRNKAETNSVERGVDLTVAPFFPCSLFSYGVLAAWSSSSFKALCSGPENEPRIQRGERGRAGIAAQSTNTSL